MRAIANSVAPRGPLDRAVPALVAGLVAATIVVIYAVSYAALVFSGSLQPHLGIGVGIGLFSAFVIAAAMALGSSYAGAVGTPQDIPAITLGIMATQVAASLANQGRDGEILTTVVVAIAVSTIAMGISFYVVGRFRLGRLIRYVPYPVIGGFLASGGWFLLRGSVSVTTGQTPTLDNIAFLLEPIPLAKALSALGIGIAIWLVRRRVSHSLAMPCLIVAAIVLFYGATAMAGLGIETLRAKGWLLGPFPDGSLWPPRPLGDVTHIDWSLLLGQAGNLATMITISLVMVLLYGGGLEVAVRQDVDFDRELRTVGIANLLTGLGGGLPGFHSFSLSVMTDRMRAASRLTGLVVAGLAGLALLFGAQAITFMPRPVVGGLLVFLGLTLWSEWLVESWPKMRRIDYATVVLILLISMAYGLLQGVAAGLVVCVVFFVVEYSRLNIVKNELSGAELTSAVVRAEDLRRLLREEGEAIHVLKLQGFVFFGTASRLVDRIRRRMDDRARKRLRFVVIDFTHIGGFDSSMVVAFTKLAQYAGERGFEICLTRLPAAFADLIRRQGIEEDRRRSHGDVTPVQERRASDPAPARHRVRIFADLDRGLEWCEEHLIHSRRGPMEGERMFLRNLLAESFPSHLDATRFMAYVENARFAKGDRVIEQGSDSEDLYFVESGRISIELEMPGKSSVRLGVLGPGTVVGEIALYLGIARSASVLAISEVTALKLTTVALRRLETEAPEIAAAFHAFMARRLSQRCLDNNRLISALSE